ncbi:MAG: hypothetical protein A2033_02435 [Bacteroidetes bacterium GWA2_31_9]|nr:MAG: hypothetical protein A2033_02435 [Bacteroidetes bacterium GWA2_31_9]
MKGYTDEQIITGIKARDNLLLERLYSKYHKRVIKYVTRNKGNKFEAEDVFHDAIEKLLNTSKSKDFKFERNFEAYFTTIYQNRWKNLARIKNKQELTSQFSDDLAYEETDLDADYKKLQIRLLAIEIIRKLDKNSRMLLEMVYLKNKTMAKIADKMDFKNEQSAKTQKFKALTKLRDLIKENSLYKKLIND